MLLIVVTITLFGVTRGINNEDGMTRFLLYNQSHLMEMKISPTGFVFDMIPLKIETKNGVLYHPRKNAVLWVQDNMVRYSYLSHPEKPSRKIWVPERIEKLLHYNWKTSDVFWYSEDNAGNVRLKMTNLNTKITIVIENVENAKLDCVDSEEEVLFFKSDDSIRLLSFDDTQKYQDIKFRRAFVIMQVMPQEKVIVIRENKDSTDEEINSVIKLVSYGGDELSSLETRDVFDQILIEGENLVYKVNMEIGIIDKSAQKTLFKVKSDDFQGLNLLYLLKPEKETSVVNKDELPMKCEKTEAEEICIHDSSNEDDTCLYQAYLLNKGKSLHYYNPALDTPTMPLPFEITGTIRAFATYLKDTVFWIDGDTNLIMKALIYSDEEPQVIAGKESILPTDLKIDEYGGNVFWTDEAKGTIEMTKLSGDFQAVMFKSLNTPRRLLLALDFGSIIWVEGETNSTVKMGWIDKQTHKLLLEGKEPVFGLVLDYIYNILYIGSQSDHLYIHAVNLNLGHKRQVYKSKTNALFSNLFFTRNNIYLLEATQVWKFNVWSQNLQPVPGTRFNTSSISPLRCKEVNENCEKCQSFCFPDSSNLRYGVSEWTCYDRGYRRLKQSKCVDASSGFMLASSQSGLYYLNGTSFTKITTVNAADLTTHSSFAALDRTKGKMFLSMKSGRMVSFSTSNLCDDGDSDPGFDHGQFGEQGIAFVDGENTVLHGLSDTDFRYGDIYTTPPRTENQRFGPTITKFSVKSYFSYPDLALVFYLAELYTDDHWESHGPHQTSIFRYDVSDRSMTTISQIPSYVTEIRLSYEERRIYYLKENSLQSIALDGTNPSSISLENVPDIKSFSFFNRKMYFISKEDRQIYLLDHLAMFKSAIPLKLSGYDTFEEILSFPRSTAVH